jgi:hypothetical protein
MGLKEFVSKPNSRQGRTAKSGELTRRLGLMWRGVLLVLSLFVPRGGRFAVFLTAWGAGFGVAAALVYTHGAEGQRWVVVAGVALVGCLVAYRCEPQARWSTQGLWIQLGALLVSAPLVIGFSYIALPVTQIVLVVAACALLLWFFLSGDSTDAATEVRRGANSHVNRDGRPKVGYRSEGDASQAAWSFEADTGERMSVYRCASCPDWHIGHARA